MPRVSFAGGDFLSLEQETISDFSAVDDLRVITTRPLRSDRAIDARLFLDGVPPHSAAHVISEATLTSSCSDSTSSTLLLTDAIELQNDRAYDLLFPRTIRGQGSAYLFAIPPTSGSILVWTESTASKGAQVNLFARYDDMPTPLIWNAASVEQGIGPTATGMDQALKMPGLGKPIYVVVQSKPNSINPREETSVRLRYATIHAEAQTTLKFDTSGIVLNSVEQSLVLSNIHRGQLYFLGATEGQSLITEVRMWNSGNCTCGGSVCDGCIFPRQCTTPSGMQTGTDCERQPGICATGNRCLGRANVNSLRNPPIQVYTIDAPRVISHEFFHFYGHILDEYVDHVLPSGALCHSDDACAYSHMGNENRPNLCSAFQHSASNSPTGHFVVGAKTAAGLSCSESASTNTTDHPFAPLFGFTPLTEEQWSAWGRFDRPVNVRYNTTTPDTSVYQYHVGLSLVVSTRKMP